MNSWIALPTTLALIYRAYSHRSLTPLGITAAALTALIHALHPWSLPFALLCVFFLTGTFVTKVKKEVKAHLTLSSTGSPGGDSARTHIQVLANSASASICILLHLWRRRSAPASADECWAYGDDVLVVGIICNYAAVTADTFSSELGILSSSPPRLLTSWNLRAVPPGTNGGVTAVGTAAGFLGAGVIAAVAVLLLPFCSTSGTGVGGAKAGLAGGEGWGWEEKVWFAAAVMVWGGLGSLLDSALGGWLQESVVDGRTGKVVEGVGGGRVLVTGVRAGGKGEGSRRVESGWGMLDNNGVNFVMAGLMTVGGMGLCGWVWDWGVGSW